MTVAERIVAELVKLGVKRIFGIPGGACSALDDALFRSTGVEHVICQNEAIAGYMAMGYSLATGVPGVVTVTSGPGILNALTPLASANADEVPLLVIAGDVARSNANRGALQDGGWSGLDFTATAKVMGMHSLRVDHSEQAVSRLTHALSLCLSPPYGAALLQIPIDVQRQTCKGAYASIVPGIIPAASSKIIEEVAQLISQSERPCLLVGMGVKRSRAVEELRALSDHLACPVLTDAEGMGTMPQDHPLYVGTYGVGDTGAGSDFLKNYDCDLLLCVGCRLDDTTTNNFSAHISSLKLVQIDYNQRRLGNAFVPEQIVFGELRNSLKQMLAATAETPIDRRNKALNVVIEVRNNHLSEDISLGEAPFDPRSFLRKLSAFAQSDTVFVSDIGNHLLAALGNITISRPEQFHFSLGLGGMGSGIGMSMGLAVGKKQVIGICGDGGALMFGNDVATVVKYGIPMVLVVFRDGQLGMVEHGVRKTYGQSDPYRIEKFDVVAWANALGAESFRLKHFEEIKRIVSWKGPGPLVVELPVDPSVNYHNPREDLVAFPSK